MWEVSQQEIVGEVDGIGSVGGFPPQVYIFSEFHCSVHCGKLMII